MRMSKGVVNVAVSAIAILLGRFLYMFSGFIIFLGTPSHAEIPMEALSGSTLFDEIFKLVDPKVKMLAELTTIGGAILIVGGAVTIAAAIITLIRTEFQMQLETQAKPAFSG